jgi:hypothetical protein
MRRFLIIFAALCCWLAQQSAPVSAASWLPLVVSGPCASYTGPLDLVVTQPTFAWGLRALACNYTGKLFNVENTTNSVTCDILAASSGGGLGNTANCSTGSFNAQAASTFCGTNCVVEKFYDQGGNSINGTPSSVAPPLAFTGCSSGSLPCAQISAAGTEYFTATTLSNITQPFTVSTVADRPSGFNLSVMYFCVSGTASFYYSTASHVVQYAGTAYNLGSGSNATWYSYQAVFNGASSNVDINGSSTATNPGTNGCTSTSIGYGPNVSASPIYMTEVIVWPTSLSATMQSNVTTNQRTYWGF